MLASISTASTGSATRMPTQNLSKVNQSQPKEEPSANDKDKNDRFNSFLSSNFN